MPLKFVFDENMGGLLWDFVRRHNSSETLQLDVVRVGDTEDLPLGSEDKYILAWAERENRLLVSRDTHSLPGELAAHLESGRRSPGILMVRWVTLEEILDFLVCLAYASEPQDWENCVTYVP
jgi:hypothetical protein